MRFSALARAQRVVPQWFGTPPSVLFWGTLSALLFVVLLLVLYVLTVLLVTKGDVPSSVLGQFDPQPAWAAGIDTRTTAPLRRMGLLPLVAEYQQSPLATLYHRWPVLRQSETCMWTLLAVALLVGSINCVTLYWFKRAIVGSAERAATQLRQKIRKQAFLLDASDPPQRLVLLFRDTVEAVRQGLVAKWEVVPQSVLLLGLLTALALWIHVWVALSALLMAILVGMAVSTLRESARRQEALLADHAAQEMSALTASMREVRHVRGLLLDDTPGEGFDVLLARYHKEALRFHTRLCGRSPWMLLLVLAGITFVGGLVGANILRQPPEISVAEAALVSAALACSVSPVRSLLGLWERLPKAELAAEDIFAYLDREPTLVNAVDAAPLKPVHEQIRLQNINLRDASGQPLLRQLSLAIPAGQRIALIATNPAEVRNVALLLARFRDPEAGQVLFDNQDLRRATLESLRQQTAIVLQEGMIFAGTVADNVGCGDPNFTLAKITEALKLTQANDFIPTLPQGLATPIGFQGATLEPSQALRIGLARVLLRNPSVVVIEEPAEEMDEESARLLDIAIQTIAHQRTVILLPSRLSTLQNAQHVYLLHEGKLAGSGTHTQLIHESELYRHQIFLKFHSKAPLPIKKPAPRTQSTATPAPPPAAPAHNNGADATTMEPPSTRAGT